MVDVIIPFYNRSSTLIRAIESVQNQSFKDWFLWLIDDGSNDGFSQKYKGESNRFKDIPNSKFLLLKENRGVSFARNQGLLSGKRKWVAFLDSDDIWHTQKLEKQIHYANKNPQYPLIHCNETWMKNGKQLNQKKKHKKQGGRIFIPSTKLCCISPSATLLKRSLLDEVGLFREDYPVCEDYDLWLKITSRYLVGFLEESLITKHGGHEDQLSKAYSSMDYWRVLSLKEHLNNAHLSSEEISQVKEVLKQKCQILIQGYIKHNNLKNKKEVEDILNSIQ